MLKRLFLLQPGVHGQVQFRRGERLVQVVIGAKVHALAAPGVVRVAGYQDQWDGGGGRLLAQMVERAVAVHVVHVHVTNDQIGQFPARHVQPRLPALGLEAAKPTPFQGDQGGVAKNFIVINDQDLLHGHSESF